MRNSRNIKVNSEYEVDISIVFKSIWNAKLIVSLFTVVVASIGVFYALSIPNFYSSKIVLSSAQNRSQQGLGALANQFGGLASLAGVNLASGSDNQLKTVIEIMKSRKFLTAFIKKYELHEEILASNGWSAEKQEFLYDEDLFDSTTRTWVREVNPPRSKIPSEAEAYKELLKVLAFALDKDTQFVTIQIQSVSPIATKYWLEKLNEEINTTLKVRDAREANQSIEFLKARIEETIVDENRNLLYELLKEQTRKVMLTQIKKDYVFTTIDPAFVPEFKAGPSRLLIVVAFTVLGFLLISIVVITLQYFKNNKNIPRE